MMYGQRRPGPKAGPRMPDFIKGTIAASYRDNGLPISVIEEIKREGDVDSIEIHEISPTELQIRVKTNRHGTRYFSLKLREMM
jgi:hypothetical protein